MMNERRVAMDDEVKYDVEPSRTAVRREPRAGLEPHSVKWNSGHLEVEGGDRSIRTSPGART